MYKFEYKESLKNLLFTYIYETDERPTFLAEEIAGYNGRRLTLKQAQKALGEFKVIAEIMAAPFKEPVSIISLIENLDYMHTLPQNSTPDTLVFTPTTANYEYKEIILKK